MTAQQHERDATERDERDRAHALGTQASRPRASAASSTAGGIPARYGLIVLGSGLLIAAITASAPLGPLANSAGREVFSVAAGALALALLVAACLRASVPARWSARYERARGFVLLCAVLLAAGTLLVFAGGYYLFAHYPPAVTYTSDIISLAHEEAQLLLTGHNPYTSDWAFRQTLLRFPNAAATPMRGHVFGYGYTQPLPSRMLAVQHEYMRSPASVPGAFDPRTLHSYPALSFLLYVPLLWAGIQNVLLLHLIAYWALVAWLLWVAPIGWRHWAALVALASMSTVAITLQSNEVVCAAFVLVAWHYLDRRWASALVLGLACAYKQYCWFFVPFFAVETVVRFGWREALWRGAIAGGAFLAPNLPFLIASPGAWFQSLWLPMSAPLFASGMGTIALSVGGVLPYAPPYAYAVVEAAVMGAVLWAYVRWRPRLRDAALVLALVPLFFAYRSLPFYFGFAPWLALYGASRIYVLAGAGHTPRIVLAITDRPAVRALLDVPVTGSFMAWWRRRPAHAGDDEPPSGAQPQN